MTAFDGDCRQGPGLERPWSDYESAITRAAVTAYLHPSKEAMEDEYHSVLILRLNDCDVDALSYQSHGSGYRDNPDPEIARGDGTYNTKYWIRPHGDKQQRLYMMTEPELFVFINVFHASKGRYPFHGEILAAVQSMGSDVSADFNDQGDLLAATLNLRSAVYTCPMPAPPLKCVDMFEVLRGFRPKPF